MPHFDDDDEVDDEITAGGGFASLFEREAEDLEPACISEIDKISAVGLAQGTEEG